MLTLSATDANGTTVPPVTAPFALETLPNALAAGHVIITPGDNLWLIARHVYGHGTLYTLIYSANASEIRDPNLIFPGQAFALPKPKS
jgi:nucleoid-associated protein YgaU